MASMFEEDEAGFTEAYDPNAEPGTLPARAMPPAADSDTAAEAPAGRSRGRSDRLTASIIDRTNEPPRDNSGGLFLVRRKRAPFVNCVAIGDGTGRLWARVKDRQEQGSTKRNETWKIATTRAPKPASRPAATADFAGRQCSSTGSTPTTGAQNATDGRGSARTASRAKPASRAVRSTASSRARPARPIMVSRPRRDTVTQQRSDVEGSAGQSPATSSKSGFIGQQGGIDSSSELVEDDEDFEKDGQGSTNGQVSLRPEPKVRAAFLREARPVFLCSGAEEGGFARHHRCEARSRPRIAATKALTWDSGPHPPPRRNARNWRTGWRPRYRPASADRRPGSHSPGSALPDSRAAAAVRRARRRRRRRDRRHGPGSAARRCG